MFFRELLQRPAGVFSKRYRCHSVHFMDKDKELRDSINEGGKIILPPSALDELSRMSVEYPLTFALSNHSVQRTTHCGVLEFIAPENTAYLPYWMMKNLMLNEGDFITVAYAQLPLCTFAKLRPSTPDFLDLDNPRIVLEKALRKFACLTRGDTIAVTFGTHVYELGVAEVRPGNSVSIIECDFQLEFDVPEGFLPAPKPAPPKVPNAAAVAAIAAAAAPPILPPEEPTSFHGVGHSLRRKKSEPGSAHAGSTASAGARPATASAGGTASGAGTTSGVAGQDKLIPRGALPFVYGVLTFPRPAPTVAAAPEPAAAPAAPFRGEGFSLKGK